MSNEPRKASEVLLDLEQKIDITLSIIRIQDLNIKILSNKLNNIIELLEKQDTEAPKFTVEAIGSSRSPETMPEFTERQIPIYADTSLQLETNPKGFRRTSRPETFSGDNDYLPESSGDINKKFPVQLPKGFVEANKNTNSPPPGRETKEVMVQATQESVPVVVNQSAKTQNIIQNGIPVSQRVVNKDGKSLFLADVEIIDTQTMTSMFKTRTNGTGKWSASLSVGSYKVIINKRESSTAPKLEATQDIQIDGTESKVDLQTIIIKT